MPIQPIPAGWPTGAATASALALAAFATPVGAFDLSSVDTRTLYRLARPTGARGISNTVPSLSPLTSEGIASPKGRNLRTQF